MFRLQNHVPDVYVQKSRDFQLFCRLLDVVQGATKYSVDSIRRISSTFECNSELLDLLKTKVGFFSSLDLSDKDLRLVIDAFPHILKNKGSIQGIQYVINLFSRINLESFESDIKIDKDNHIIYVVSSRKFKNNELFTELINYVLPAGYIFDYNVATPVKQNLFIYENSTLDTTWTKDFDNVSIVDNRFDSTKEPVIDVANNVGLTNVYNYDEAKKSDEEITNE